MASQQDLQKEIDRLQQAYKSLKDLYSASQEALVEEKKLTLKLTCEASFKSVFVLMHQIPYDVTNIEGVYSTREKAEAELERLVAITRYNDWHPFKREDLWVSEEELDQDFDKPQDNNV